MPATLAFVFLIGSRTLAVNPAWPNPEATRDQLALPQNWPDDPGYGYLSRGVCTSGSLKGQTVWRPQGGQWNLWGFYPPDTKDPCGDPSVVPYSLQETLSQNELTTMHGTGLSADVAWTMTTGDPRVLIAVHDSGAEWGEPDLVNKWWLNAGELPKPRRADGTDCPVYDCNGDGVFNVLDYTSGRGHDQPVFSIVTDPRLLSAGDSNGNGLLDPEDLIHAFSDGVDDDHNGFVDDICGWDFFEGDNDPADDVHYGHGTGEAKDSSAEGNNGIGETGVCPDCRVMPVRVGDSFIADADHFAEGVFFALSHGANVIQEALGSVNDTPLMQRAIDAAYAGGTIVIASAADEDSLHHNYPGNAEHTTLVHAITHDNDAQNASSFLFFNNCTNGGAHLVLSTPGASCSSEATGKSSGMAGLIYSAMLKFHPNDAPLTAAEAMQLMWSTSEDIDVPGSLTNPNLYPSGPGWDLYFGWGRNDAGAAVAAVRDGKIPPEVDVTAPRWFETFDPGQTPTLTITGHVAANRAPSYDFKVLVAPGVQPQPSDYQVAATVTGATTATDGTLATFSLQNLVPNPSQTSTDVQAFSATILVQAVAHYGGTIGDVPGTFLKSFFVHQDPDLFTGFPLYVGASGESSPHFADLDGSGHDSLVVGITDGSVHAFQADGSELPGWPVRVQPLPDVSAHPAFPAFGPNGPAQGTAQALSQAVAVGSLHGDGKLQVVASTADGQLYAWNADGSPVSGFPVHADFSHYLDGTHDTTLADGTQVSYVLGKGFFAAPTLYDLGGDGRLEIIQPGQDGWLYVWDDQGQPWPGFPVEIYDPNGGTTNGVHQIQHGRLMTTAAVGDINGDGQPEIVVGSNEAYGTQDCRAYAVWHDGMNHAGGPYLPGWPVDPKGLRNDFLPDVGLGMPNAAALADIGNGKLDVEINGMASSPLFYDGSGAQLGSADGNSVGAKAAVTDVPNFVAISYASFGDVDGDGKVDVVDGTVGLTYVLGGLSGTGRYAPSHAVNAWSVQKDYQGSGPGFVSEPLPGLPQPAADFQFFMNYTIADVDGDGKNEILSGSGVYLLTAYRADGSSPSGWPKNTGGWIIATPAVGDLDGDGLLDVATLTREGWLYVWHGKGLASQKIEWESFHHDAQNTGNYETPLPVRHGPPAKAKSGCGTAPGPEAWLGLLALAGLAWRRRTR
ncbi:MAG: S8 family serine peptidase [Myxococcales bacterium]